jgi:F0F1-type ATP synthase membrane subunit b/b'
MDINTIFETNFLNLIVVIGLVVKFIGGAATDYLDDRLVKIAKRFASADEEQDIANKILNDAKLALETASQYASTTMNQCLQTILEETNQQTDLLGLELARLESEYSTRINSKTQDALKTLGYALIRQALEDAEWHLEQDCRFFNRKSIPYASKCMKTFLSFLDKSHFQIVDRGLESSNLNVSS